VIWLLIGVLIALIVQWFYDFLGTALTDALAKNKYFKPLAKFFGGFVPVAIFTILILVLYFL
jgi:hypothetical protein